VIENRKTALVIGGGIAGLEAAITIAGPDIGGFGGKGPGVRRHHPRTSQQLSPLKTRLSCCRENRRSAKAGVQKNRF
jgi:hypothetical protein